MRSIDKYYIDNIGSITKIQYIAIDEIDSMSRPIHGVGTITLKNNSEWYNLYFTPYTADYKMEFKSDHKGSYFAFSVSASIPVYSEHLNTMINFLTNHSFVVKIYDANGYIRALGSLDFPCKFQYKGTTGQKPADKNHIVFEFSANSKYAPIMLYEPGT